MTKKSRKKGGREEEEEEKESGRTLTNPKRKEMIVSGSDWTRMLVLCLKSCPFEITLTRLNRLFTKTLDLL